MVYSFTHEAHRCNIRRINCLDVTGISREVDDIRKLGQNSQNDLNMLNLTNMITFDWTDWIIRFTQLPQSIGIYDLTMMKIISLWLTVHILVVTREHVWLYHYPYKIYMPIYKKCSCSYLRKLVGFGYYPTPPNFICPTFKLMCLLLELP